MEEAFLSHRAKHRSWPPTSTRGRTKSEQYIQGVSGHEASNLQVAEEPLQADEWLNTIEQKFRLLRVTEHLKAEYASHQLQGLAGIWWTHFLSSLPANARVT